MSQNIYDNPEFLTGYSQLPRSTNGLDGAPEWASLKALIPDLMKTRVVDLGCGFGWFCRWAEAQGAESVLGLDISDKMLERAMSETTDTTIDYRREDLEHLDLQREAFDLVYSSLALHYIANLRRLLKTVFDALTSSGTFLFSVEHPIFSAPSQPQFVQSTNGRRFWALDDYLIEGTRSTNWFADNVIKQHRTIGTYVNELVAAGFVVTHLEEWEPTDEQVLGTPEWADERHRPPFLLIRAVRPRPTHGAVAQ